MMSTFSYSPTVFARRTSGCTRVTLGNSENKSRSPVRNPRLIARLDVKGPNLIKGIQMEGLRVIGDPREHANMYYSQGVDEILFVDIVASLYGRNNLVDVVARTAEEVFIPMTVGGGIRKISDVRDLLNAGADKVSMNTAALNNPNLIREISDVFGSQCVVLSVEAKSVGRGKWEAYTHNGREKSGIDVLKWIQAASQLGIGEILLTSIDREGTRKGLDLELVAAIRDLTNLPLIISGGLREPRDFADAVSAGADAVAVADALHYRRFSVAELRSLSNLADRNPIGRPIG